MSATVVGIDAVGTQSAPLTEPTLILISSGSGSVPPPRRRATTAARPPPWSVVPIHWPRPTPSTGQAPPRRTGRRRRRAIRHPGAARVASRDCAARELPGGTILPGPANGGAMDSPGAPAEPLGRRDLPRSIARVKQLAAVISRSVGEGDRCVRDHRDRRVGSTGRGQQPHQRHRSQDDPAVGKFIGPGRRGVRDALTCSRAALISSPGQDLHRVVEISACRTGTRPE